MAKEGEEEENKQQKRKQKKNDCASAMGVQLEHAM